MLGPAQPGKKVIIGSIIDDWMVIFLIKGAREENLRSISLEICHQERINDKDLEGTDGVNSNWAINTTSRSTFKQFSS